MGDRITDKSVPAENRMGWMRVDKLLLTMSIPMMFSMLIQALYNIVDSVFVAQISENALTAVSLAFPMQNLIIAVATGTGVGINALLSKSLGEKNFKRANKTANTAFFLAIISWLIFVVIGIFAIRPFFAVQTDVAEIVDGGTVYLTICCVASIGIFVQIATERLLQATSRATLSMVVQIFGAVINLILDPLLIFGLLGFPKLGIMGAAVATVTGQILSAVLGIIMNIKKNPEITINLGEILKPEGSIIKRVYSVGVPSIIMASVGSVMNFGMNKILLVFSTTAAAVFGVYFKINSFFFMPVFGLNNGLVPIMAYNYGAKKGRRMFATFKFGALYATVLLVFGFSMFMIFPGQLLKLFNASDYMLSIGIPCLRIISISFLIAGFCIICGSVFQALGNAMLSLWVSVARQLVVLLPAAYFLAKLGGVNAVWWCYPIAEIASFTLSFIFIRKMYREKMKPYMKDDEPGVKTRKPKADS